MKTGLVAVKFPFQASKLAIIANMTGTVIIPRHSSKYRAFFLYGFFYGLTDD